MTTPFITDARMQEGLDASETTQRMWMPVPEIPNYIWSENPKRHDIGALIQIIQDVGFKDTPRFNENLPNTQGSNGAFVYGNGRATALYQMWKAGDYDLPGNVVEIEGVWHMPFDSGLDSDLALARSFGIDHNILPLSGGDYGVKEMMAIFDEEKLATVWEASAKDGANLVTLDSDDLKALWKYLEEPAFDTGNALPATDSNGASVNVGDDASSETALPPSAIRQVQLFFDTETIQEFSELASELRDRYEIQKLSDLVLHIMREVAGKP